MGGMLFSRSCRFSLVSLAVSSLQLCDGTAAVQEYLVEKKEQGNASTHDRVNVTRDLLDANQHLASGLECGFLERLVEATRRRRFGKHLQRGYPLANESDIPSSLGDHVWMNTLSGVGMSFLAGLSTTIGAGVIFLLPGNQISPAQMSFVLALAGGVMVSTTILEFWLPAISLFCVASMMRVLVCSAVGALSFLLLTKFVPEPHFNDLDIEQCTQSSVESFKAQVHSWHFAKVLMLSLTAHNFPEGFAVAVSSLGSKGSGFVVMRAIAMHNIPEGIAIAVPVLASTGSRKKVLWMTLLSGMAEPVGAVVALFCIHAMGNITHDWIEALLCVVGGIMVAVAGTELLPNAWSLGKPHFFVTGSLTDVFLMIVTIMCGA